MRHLSPRELADALGVSESSLKRWVDSGKLTAFRTEGGHRRIAVSEALRFIRETRAPVARPELLGMPEVALGQRSGNDSLLHCLLEGDVAGTRGFLLARHLEGSSVAELADGPVRQAMEQIGELWLQGKHGIFIEHRATDTCLQAVAYLRAMIDPPENAPLAVGGVPEDDTHMLQSFIAATVLASTGLRVVNLGADTPLAAFQHAVEHHHPRLVWVSACMPINPARAKTIRKWLASLGPSVATVVGGQSAEAIAEKGVTHVTGMSELAAFASRTLASPTRLAAR